MNTKTLLMTLVVTTPAAFAQENASLIRLSEATGAAVTAHANVASMYGSDSSSCDDGEEPAVDGQGHVSAGTVARAVIGEVNATSTAMASIEFNHPDQSASNLSGITQHAVVGQDSWQGGDYLGGGGTTHLVAAAEHVVSAGDEITSGYGDLAIAWMSAGTHGGSAWFMMDYSLQGSWIVELGCVGMQVLPDANGTNVFASNGGMMWVPNDIDGGAIEAHFTTTVGTGSPGLITGYQRDEMRAMLCGVPGEVNTMQAGSQAIIIARLKVTSPTDDTGQPNRFWANGIEIDGYYP